MNKSGLLRLGYLLAMLLPLVALAAGPIPEDNRILGGVTTTISAPADQPLTMPTDVCPDGHGGIYVVDGANDRIVRFAADGKLAEQFTGPADMPLKAPVAIKRDAAGTLWIADTGNARLVLRAGDGTYTAITVPAPDAKKHADPTGLAIKPDGKRTYVVDADSHRVLIRDNASGEWKILGGWGVALGQFRWPYMICMGAEDYVIVTEAVGARAQMISPEDHWAGQIARFGVAMGDLYRPKGVAVDAAGRVFIGDSTIGVIQVFGTRGNLIGVLTDEQGQPLRFEHPMGLCFDETGKLYVVELSANRVAMVNLKVVGK